MKIAILVAGLPPIYNGGTEIATVSIAEHAAKAGHDVHVIALDGTRKGQEAYKALENGFHVHRIRTLPYSYVYGVAAIPAALHTISKLQPDLIHAQGIQVGLAAMLASQITGIPYLLYSRGEIFMEWMMKEPMSKLILGKANRVVSQTNAMKKEMEKYCKGHIEVIPNGVDIEKFGKIEQNKAREQLGLPHKLDKRGLPAKGSEIIMSVGKFRQEKNMELFLKIAAIDLSNPMRTYVSVGSGKEFANVINMANHLKSGVVFVGEVDNSKIPVYMAAADILVNTSHSEGFPVTILEAYASGLPVVVPNISGLSEIITEAQNGLLYEPNNERSAIKAIDMILTNQKFRGEISGNNKRKAREYTWENTVNKLYTTSVS